MKKKPNYKGFVLHYKELSNYGVSMSDLYRLSKIYNTSLNILKQGLSGLGTKSDSKQKRSEALMTISGKPEKIVKSTTSETKKLIKRGNPLALAGG